MLRELSNSQKLMFFTITVPFFCVVFLLLLSMSMQKELTHDEHQFIASGELSASRLLLPYEGYPHFHMPNLVFVYALIFTFTDRVLLAGRVLSVVRAWSSLVLVFFIAFNLLRGGIT